MGLLDIFRGRSDTPRPVPTTLPTTGLDGAATKMVARLLDVGIDGSGPFDSAREVADRALQRAGGNQETAVDKIVAEHVRLAAAEGFATGLGGFITLPVALPANVVGFYIIATRMTAAVAAVRGYDISSEAVRAAVLLSLVGADAADVLQKAGYAVPAGRIASIVSERLPGPVLMAVNKGIGFRLVSQAGRKSLSSLGKGIPLAGGLIGAALDGYMVKRIADHVRREFPVRAVGSGV